jgi:trehalose 6-phosphate phosphatase
MDAASLLAPLAVAPGRSALVFDLDGTLAPIVARPELAVVPPTTRAELARLVQTYLLVGCLSGRRGDEAASLLDVQGVRCIGNHGLELAPDAAELADRVGQFRVTVAGRWPVEDKRLSLSFHFREADDEQLALAVLAEIAHEAEARGLTPRWGRKVLEIRPASTIDKGTAVTALLGECGASRGLYAGDDSTDLDAFRGLGDAGLEHAVRIAVTSPEAPPALAASADLVVESPGELAVLLRRL